MNGPRSREWVLPAPSHAGPVAEPGCRLWRCALRASPHSLCTALLLFFPEKKASRILLCTDNFLLSPFNKMLSFIRHKLVTLRDNFMKISPIGYLLKVYCGIIHYTWQEIHTGKIT